MNVEKVVASMFGLIILFLLLSRAAEFNLIIGTIGDFVTRQTEALQGRGTVPVVAPTGPTGSISPGIGNIFRGSF